MIYGNQGDDQIFGGGGAFSATDAADTLYGGVGSDLIYGNGGDDLIYGGGTILNTNDGGDTLLGGAGNDILHAKYGDDHLYGLIGNDTLYGGLGNDLFYYSHNSGADLIVRFDNPGTTAGDTPNDCRQYQWHGCCGIR